MRPLLSADPSRIGGYRLLGRLGAGGMGVVYLARSSGGGLVAVKVIQAEYAGDPGFRARFRREVAAARRVDSRWAVPVPDADTEADAPWLATAFVPGPSLREAVTAHGPLPESGVRHLGAMLAEALQAVHDAGLVHRDVKPGNVLLALDGPRLIDFGIARSRDDTALTARDGVVGSPGYLSPEQAQPRGRTVGPPSDIFSLGCVLGFAATGRRVFGTGSPAALLYRTVHDPPGLDGVPEALRPLLESCLDKDPSRRPTADRLGRALAAEAATGADTGWLPQPVTRLIAERSAATLALPDVEPTLLAPAEREDRRPTRRRLLTAASGGAVLAAGGGFGIWAALRPEGGGASGGGQDRVLPHYTIGVQADLRGARAAAGTAQERGARLAVERLNSRADRAFTLTLKPLDDRGSRDGAPGVARRMADDPAVIAVLGPTTDAVCRAVLPVYHQARLPLVSVSVDKDEVSPLQYDAYLHLRPPSSGLAVPLLSWIAHHPPSRTALILDRDAGDYSWDLTRSMRTALTGNDRPSVTVSVPAGTDDFSAVAAKVRATGADAAVFTGLAHNAALLAPELRAAGFTGTVLATEPVMTADFLRQAGKAAQGWVFGSTLVDPTVLPTARSFAASYTERFGTAPPPFAAESYDAVGFIARAIRDAGPAGVEGPSVARRMRAMRYEGITKTYAIEPGSGTMKPGIGLFLYRVEKGRFAFLGDYRTVGG